VITRAFIASDFLVNFNSEVLAGKSLGNQNMVDTKASVSSESHHAVIPPGIGFFRLFKGAERVR